jgi:hypothetical protein
VLFEFFIQLLEGFIDSELASVVREDMQEPRELAGAAWAESIRRVSEWGKVDAPEIFHHLRGERVFFVGPAPSLGSESAGALVGIGVADMYMGFELALGVGNERWEEVSLVILRESVEDVMELNGAGRGAPFRPIDVILRQSETGFVLVVQ